MPDEWKRLLPIELQETPVIWFTDNLAPKGSYIHPSRCLVQVDTGGLDKTKLEPIKGIFGWWVFAAWIPPQAIREVARSLYRKGQIGRKGGVQPQFTTYKTKPTAGG